MPGLSILFDSSTSKILTTWEVIHSWLSTYVKHFIGLLYGSIQLIYLFWFCYYRLSGLVNEGDYYLQFILYWPDILPSLGHTIRLICQQQQQKRKKKKKLKLTLQLLKEWQHFYFTDICLFLHLYLLFFCGLKLWYMF